MLAQLIDELSNAVHLLADIPEGNIRLEDLRGDFLGLFCPLSGLFFHGELS